MTIDKDQWAKFSQPQRDAIQARQAWLATARPKQLPPEGDWQTWFLCSGRGSGKTRSSTEDAAWWGMTNSHARVGIIAAKFGDARDVYFEGESGLLRTLPSSCVKTWNRSLGELVLVNETRYKAFSAEEPESLRGFQFGRAYADELGSWRYQQETWDQLMFCLRLGNDPKIIITTTPRPTKLVKSILADPRTIVVRESTFANEANLSKVALNKLREQYAGTRLGRQELEAEVLEDVQGALWSRKQLDELRVKKDKLPDMQRVIVAIDPAVGNPDKDDPSGMAETGIVAVGLGVDGMAYVLSDYTTKASPEGWAKRAISAYDQFEADAIVAEVNQGGQMVQSTIRAVRANAKFIAVRASKGKVTRAEPVSALYEQGKVRHLGTMAELEDQMCAFTVEGIVGDTTGDRVDALVWGLTELFPRLTKKVRPNGGNLIVEGVNTYNPHSAITYR